MLAGIEKPVVTQGVERNVNRLLGLTAVAHLDQLAIEIIKRSDARRFVVLPRRWVVERTIAWLNRCRRLAKDWEASSASSEAWLVIASIRRMTRRIAKLEL